MLTKYDLIEKNVDEYLYTIKSNQKISINSFLQNKNIDEIRPILNFLSKIKHDSMSCNIPDSESKNLFTSIRAIWLNGTFESNLLEEILPTKDLGLNFNEIIEERSILMAKPVHTVKNGNGWANKQAGKTVSEHHTQENAIDKASSIAKKGHTEHVIHGRDGKIREKNSYGNDPYPPKG